MAIETQMCPCVVVRCDRCEEALPLYEDGSYAHFEDEQQALEEARSSDWYIADGVLLCLSCVEDATFYEVECPKCGVAKEESCNIDIGLFCEERIAALAASVVKAGQKDA